MLITNSTNSVPPSTGYETVNLSLAATIPTGQIVNAGEEVFPVLRQMLAGNVRLLALVNERDRLGQEKHGQPLKTGDERDTAREALNEVLDLMAYLTKQYMQSGNDWRWRLRLRDTIRLATDILDTIDDVKRYPEAQP